MGDINALVCGLAASPIFIGDPLCVRTRAGTAGVFHVEVDTCTLPSLDRGGFQVKVGRDSTCFRPI